MNARGNLNAGSGTNKWLVAALLVALMPALAMAWDDAGTFTVGGSVGVGTETPARQMHLLGNNAAFRMDRDIDTAAFMLVRTSPGNFNSIRKTFVVGANASAIGNGEFVINDLGTAVSGAGTTRLKIGNTGILSTFGQNRLSVATNTPGGYNVRGRLDYTTATILSDAYNIYEEAFLALNSDEAIICSPGDGALLRVVDEDNDLDYYRLYNQELQFGYPDTFVISATNQQAGDQLLLKTTGEMMNFVTDSDNNTDQWYAYSWYHKGTATANKLMGLTGVISPSGYQGNLGIRGGFFANQSFDLAEAYWKRDPAIGAGDVVRIDPAAPNAVVLARQANDPAVVGVISTDPSIVMGGGAFCTNNLAHLWGDEVVALFVQEQAQIEAGLMAADQDLQARAAKLVTFESFSSASAMAVQKPGDVALLKEKYALAQQQLTDTLEERAIDVFCRRHLAILALAGRVPVKVDASYGAIRPGDALVASVTPGHAMRADNPAVCTVIGKALEAKASGQGLIMMQVMNR